MVINRQTLNYQGKKLIEKVVFAPPFKFGTVFQNQGCFLYFKDDEAKFLSSEDNQKMKEREAVLLRCGTYFIDFIKKAKTDTVEVIAVHLYPEILKKLYIKELPNIIKKHKYSKKSQFIASEDAVPKYIESLDFYFSNPTFVNDDLLELKMKELILILVQTQNITSVLELITDLYSSRVTSLKRVIELHLYSNLSLEELAKLSNLSLSSFKREFKKEFNDSPNNYITNKRIEKAKELLNVTDLSITEVAYETGFNDPHYFTKVFKKKTEHTPSSYRNVQNH